MQEKACGKAGFPGKQKLTNFTIEKEGHVLPPFIQIVFVIPREPSVK